MVKKFFTLLLVLPTLAMANLEQNLIGQWECKGLEHEYFRYASDIEYRDDGTVTEQTVIYNWAADDSYQVDDVKTLSMKTLSKWQVIGDNVRYYDHVIQSHAVDASNYDTATGFANYDKDAVSLVEAMIERSELEKEVYDETIARIRFIDKNTYISAINGAEDNFPTDIKNNHCKRKI